MRTPRVHLCFGFAKKEVVQSTVCNITKNTQKRHDLHLQNRPLMDAPSQLIVSPLFLG
jgi:hypothetical protein